MMRADAKPGMVIVALKRAIEATFDGEQWLELGYLTGTIDQIRKHPRLLRSLSWGDDDYAQHVLWATRQVLGKNNENIRMVEEFVGLEKWLRENDLAMHKELYGDEPVTMEKLEEAGKVHGVHELLQHVARIKRSVPEDPSLAIGSAKELLETTLKTILTEQGERDVDDDIPALLKRVQSSLGLDNKQSGPLGRINEVRKRTTSNLAQVVIGVAEIRNLIGTGHGRTHGPQADIAHARLVVSAAATVATYLWEVWEAKRESVKSSPS